MADRDRLAHLQGLPDLTVAARGQDLRDFRHDPESLQEADEDQDFVQLQRNSTDLFFFRPMTEPHALRVVGVRDAEAQRAAPGRP